MLGRRFIGCDIDKVAVAKASDRISEAASIWDRKPS
jgi:hypothetical protein